MTNCRRHFREEPRTDHAEGKNQNGIFWDQPDGKTEKAVTPGKKERSIGFIRIAEPGGFQSAETKRAARLAITKTSATPTTSRSAAHCQPRTKLMNTRAAGLRTGLASQ